MLECEIEFHFRSRLSIHTQAHELILIILDLAQIDFAWLFRLGVTELMILAEALDLLCGRVGHLSCDFYLDCLQVGWNVELNGELFAIIQSETVELLGHWDAVDIVCRGE